MSEVEKHRGIGAKCKLGRHHECPAPAACRCPCHGERDEPRGKHACPSCPESFDSAARLREHERAHERARLVAGVSELRCDEPGCRGRTFAGPQGLASHSRTHATTAAQIEAAATNGERGQHVVEDSFDRSPGPLDAGEPARWADGGEVPAGTVQIDPASDWVPFPTSGHEGLVRARAILDDALGDRVEPEASHVAEYDARMAALADDVELGWPHRCAERYVNLLINQLADEPYSEGRAALMDRIERVLGLHPTEP